MIFGSSSSFFSFFLYLRVAFGCSLCISMTKAAKIKETGIPRPSLSSSLSSSSFHLYLNINEKEYHNLPSHLQFDDLRKIYLLNLQVNTKESEKLKTRATTSKGGKGKEKERQVIVNKEKETDCPCSDSSLCNPICQENPKEIFGFMGGVMDNYKWKFYDWDVLTTLAWPPASALPDLVCHAHEKKVRILANAYGPPLTANLTARAEWIKSSLVDVVTNHYDGLVFDHEGPLDYHAIENQYYIDLVRETRAVLRTYYSPFSKIAVCLSWNPFGVDGRYYNNKGLSDVSDFSYIMNYDTRSQIIDRCTASANAPLFSTIQGLNQYIDIGLEKSKLILGVPWYGYNYTCLQENDNQNGNHNDNDNDANIDFGFTEDQSSFFSRSSRECMIRQVPFRGINCSDAAGGQVPYESIMGKKALSSSSSSTSFSSYHNYRESKKNNSDGSSSSIFVTSHWDNYTHSPYINVYTYIYETKRTGSGNGKKRGKNSFSASTSGAGSSSISPSESQQFIKKKTKQQIWYDNPESLRYKYQVAKELGIRGVGPFTFDKLDYTGNDTKRFIEGPREAKEMWKAFDTFLSAS